MAINYLHSIDLNKNELQNAKIHVLSSAPSSPAAGQIYYNSTDSKLYFYDGTNWVDASGDIKSVTSNNTNQLTVTDSTGPNPGINVVTGTVTNNGTALATGDQIYDFVTGFNYLTANQSITLSGDIAGTGTTAITTTIQANAVEGAMLNNDVISAQTDLPSGIASTDELLISDAGVLKKTDVSVLETYMQNNLTFTSNTDVDVSVDNLETRLGEINSSINIGNATGVDTTISGDLTVDENLSVSGSATITGDLTVNGTTTTVNSTTVTVDDPVFTLGGDTAPSADDNKDRGIEFRYHDGTNAKLGFFGFDDSTGRYTFLTSATNTSEVFSGTKADLDIANVYLSGSIKTVDGSAPTNGQLLIGNSTNSDMQLATLTAGEGIDVTNAAGSITIEAEDASASNKGVVELATTAEALAGSDTSRAVTPAGLAARSYAATIGDGSATSIAVTHSLNTRDVIVQIYDVTNYDTVYADVVRTNTTQCTITFATAPASGAYRVLVTKID